MRRRHCQRGAHRSLDRGDEGFKAAVIHGWLASCRCGVSDVTGCRDDVDAWPVHRGGWEGRRRHGPVDVVALLGLGRHVEVQTNVVPVGAAWVHTWWALVVTVAAVFVAGTASSSPGEGKPPGGPSKTCACMDTGEHAPLTVAGQIVSLLPARFPLPPCSSP